jgi:endonuclease/exonuclease/phosphatase family metal-dependent hydrolase
LDAILSEQPNALIIITGDFNPNSTGLQSKEIAQPNHLKQLVKFKTRDSGILDWMFVNKPKMFDLTRLPKIGTSDHYTILAKPKSKSETKPVIKKIKIYVTLETVLGVHSEGG